MGKPEVESARGEARLRWDAKLQHKEVVWEDVGKESRDGSY